MTSAAEPFAVHEVQRPGRSVGAIHRPRTLAAALEVLSAHSDARPIAGGSDLLLDLHRGGPGAPMPLVDLTGIEGFRTITDEGDAWVLAGGVTHNQVVSHDGLLADALPLAQACLEIGSPQLRNRATIAGNLATASPANDSISALLALGATLELEHGSGSNTSKRTVAVEDFFDGFRSTVLAPGELITAIRVPKLVPDARGLWVKLGLRRAQAISVVHAGFVVELDGETVISARVAVGSVAPTVILLPEVTEALAGRTLDADTISTAAEVAARTVEPIDDGRATADYRRAGVRMLVERALQALADGRQADMWPTDPPTLSSAEQLAAPAPVPVEEVGATVTIRVNGEPVTAGSPGSTLLDWIRDEAGGGEDRLLSGVKEGCAEGECGACTVLVDGVAAMSCLIAAGQSDGAEVVTVEGLADGERLAPIQSSFVDEFAVQCGFCIPGFLVAGHRLLDEVDQPTEEQIRLALSGNLCRCTGYYPIIEAVKSAGQGSES